MKENITDKEKKEIEEMTNELVAIVPMVKPKEDSYTDYCKQIATALRNVGYSKETITFPIELQYGDLTNYIGYGQSKTEKLVAISFGVLKEKGSYFGEEKEGEKPLFIAYFDRIESLEVLENLVNIGKARLAELEDSDGTQNN